MSDNDWRKRSANFQTPRVERNIQLRDALKPIAKRHDTTVSAIAIGWTLAWPGVTGAIVGARSPGQIDGWINAGAVRLTAQDLAEVAEAIRISGAGVGPASA